jgi:hypothetical protein
LNEMAAPVLTPAELARARSRILSMYFSVVAISILAIAVLIAYIVSLGALVGPGVESSLGFALALLFLLAALLVHLLDRAYREWPLGRRVHPTAPGSLSAASMVTVVRWVVVAAAAAIIIYLLATLLTS